MILNTSPQVEAYRFYVPNLYIKVYLILSNVDDNATPKVFHDGVGVIGSRATGEDPPEKIRQRISD